jgi:hypothetical protein
MIIEIRLSEDLPTRAQNRLRYAIELGRWRVRRRRAEEAQDYWMLDILDLEFELVGLP